MRNPIVIASAAFFLFLPLLTSDAQEAIFLVRHAEQAGPGSANPPLTEAGKARARALAGVLKDAGINVIYSTESVRTIQTAQPIASALKVEPKIHPRQDIDGLISLLRKQHARERVLIIGHSLTVPRLLKSLGHPADITIAPKEYGDLFVIIPKNEGSPLVLHLRY